VAINLAVENAMAPRTEVRAVALAPVYIEAAKFLAGILFEAALFGQSKAKTKDAIAAINQHIVMLYNAVAELAVRQDAIRKELIDLIEEVEYRSIAFDIYGTSDVLKLLAANNDKTIFPAAFLNLSITSKRLIDRLDASFDTAFVRRYAAYLDLMLTNTTLFVFVTSLMDSLSLDEKLALIEEVKTKLKAYIEFIKVHILFTQKQRFTVTTGPNGLDCFNDDDGSVISCTQEWGYIRDKDLNTYKRVTSVELYPGGPAAIAAAEEARKKAIALVDAEIDKEANQLADQIWKDTYGSIKI
jgi:hypothetical protein